jgi:hypothetical protein
MFRLSIVNEANSKTELAWRKSNRRTALGETRQRSTEGRPVENPEKLFGDV